MIRSVLLLPCLLLGMSSHCTGDNGLSGEKKHDKEASHVEKNLKNVAKLTADLPQSISAGQKAELQLELTNCGTQVITIVSNGYITFLLDVKSKDKKSVPHTLFSKRIFEPDEPRMGSVATVALTPGKKASVSFDLNRLFDLSMGGRYFVKIEARFSDGKASHTIVIDELSFEIGSGSMGRVITD